MFCGALGFHEPLLKNTELDYIYPHTWKFILSTNPTTHWLDWHRNAFRPNDALLLPGTKLESTYKS